MNTSLANTKQDDVLSTLDVETELERVDTKAVAILNRSDLECQLDAAHRYPRSIKRFMQHAAETATLTQEVASSCIYTLPRGGKPITGPSVRLAEICASSWRNLHVASRVVDVDDKEVVAQGVAWDLETNVRVTVETRRRIVDKKGARYNDDMINVTGAAAGSIALRNAIFRAIPRAYVDEIYKRARQVAVGDARTLSDRRSAVFANFAKLGVAQDRVLARVQKLAIEDVGLDELETLIGLGTAIRDHGANIDEAFPSVGGAPTQKPETKAIEEKLRAAPPAPEPKGRDWARESEAFKASITAAIEKKDPALIKRVRHLFEDFCKECPPEVSEELVRFYSLMSSDKS